GSCCVGNGLFQGFACRKASLDVRKPDTERAIRFFFNDRYILCRHRFAAHLSRPPASQLVDPTHKAGRQIFAWMSHGNNRLGLRMLERVVIATDPIKNPPVSFQHCDQLAAVSFHRRLQKHHPKRLPRLPLLSISGSKPALGRAYSCPLPVTCVNIYTLFV